MIWKTITMDRLSSKLYQLKLNVIRSTLKITILCWNSVKKKWTEEQEDELRQLHMENQQNPSTDKGMWMYSFVVKDLISILIESFT